jgi:hypothetical protein
MTTPTRQVWTATIASFCALQAERTLSTPIDPAEIDAGPGEDAVFDSLCGNAKGVLAGDGERRIQFTLRVQRAPPEPLVPLASLRSARVSGGFRPCI